MTGSFPAPILCTICARGGSKGVPGKNLRPLAGKPLIAHTIRQARDSGIFAAVAVGSDSDAILDAATEHGVDFAVRRPAALATDGAAKPPAIRHCAERVEKLTGARFSVFVDLDATAPLRDPADIVGAVRLLHEAGVGNVISGTPARRSPYFNLVECDADGAVRLSKRADSPVWRRQSSPPCFDLNASIYAWTRAAFFAGPEVFRDDTRLYEMPPERSVDIDGEFDWQIAEWLFSRMTTGASN